MGSDGSRTGMLMVTVCFVGLLAFSGIVIYFSFELESPTTQCHILINSPSFSVRLIDVQIPALLHLLCLSVSSCWKNTEHGQRVLEGGQ